MTSQGLRASPEGIKAAKTALTDKTLSQYKLAAALGITRQPVSKFFAGESVSRSCFVQICQQLGLSWQKVAGLPEDTVSEATNKVQPKSVDLDTLVRKIRQQRQDKIPDQCGTLQMLDIAQAISVLDIYTNVNVLEELTCQQWLEISDLMQDLNHESNFKQLAEASHQRKLPGLEAVSRYSKLMVLGKPGSGKTTFLQYLAIACNKGDFQPQHIAIFVRLKEFAEDAKENNQFNLLKYISQEFLSCGVEEESTATILTEGKALILLDGLDEVPSDNAERVTREIRRFTQVYYKNQFVISSRIAAQQYRFQGFTEVEVTDFNYEQVEAFVKKWFVAVAHKSREDGEARGNLFIHQLNLPENQQIRELAITPILLHLICLVFHVKAEFPSNLTKLYEQILNILLVRWDETKGVKRQTFPCHLTVNSKKKLLSQIAAITFEQGNYFFTQEKIQQLITNYIGTLLNLSIDSIQFQEVSEVALQLIEVQEGLLVERARGIYSFSHLALHEYFVAKNIVESQDQGCKSLVTHITEAHWHNIFLLTVSMLPNANEILGLMKRKIDLLVAKDNKIQDFLIWLRHKSISVSTSYKAAAVRAFYLVCVRRTPAEYLFAHVVRTASLTTEDEDSFYRQHHAFVHTPSYELEYALVGNIAFNSDLALDEFLTSTLTCAGELDFAVDLTLNDALVLDHAHALSIAFDEALNLVLEPEFKKDMQKLKKQLPPIESYPKQFRCWWQANGKVWGEKLRSLLIKHRNIGHDWQFNQQQIELLQQYYEANKLLVDCLNRSANVTPLARQEIEEALLLAIADIQN
ncbi:histidine kinase [Nostoc minutum NIES-26]|uniref:Histidine kinase n=1 Tax=Nostoc minutum NIES-26 TaxID=1844469 RepID=A0A367RZ75_9NOSO|nr:histidine kinase [Nostoc minutum NIES-26]